MLPTETALRDFPLTVIVATRVLSIRWIIARSTVPFDFVDNDHSTSRLDADHVWTQTETSGVPATSSASRHSDASSTPPPDLSFQRKQDSTCWPLLTIEPRHDDLPHDRCRRSHLRQDAFRQDAAQRCQSFLNSLPSRTDIRVPVEFDVDHVESGSRLTANGLHPLAPSKAISIGCVTSVSTSSVASPGHSVMMITRGRSRSGNTSIGICVARYDRTPSTPG